jgi:hypothetical protein
MRKNFHEICLAIVAVIMMAIAIGILIWFSFAAFGLAYGSHM